MTLPAFLAGMLAGLYTPAPPRSEQFLLVYLFLAAAGVWLLWLRRTARVVPRRLRSAYGMLLLLLAVGAGVVHAWAAVERGLHSRLPTALEGVALTVQGSITGVPREDSRRVQFLLQVSDSRVCGELQRQCRLRLSWYERRLPLQPGELWQLEVKLKRPHGYANPGSFDYERWLFAHRIAATGYVLNRKHQDRLTNRRLATTADTALFTSLHEAGQRWRQAMLKRLRDATETLQHSGLLLALGVGYRDAITAPARDVLRSTGTAHLLAISGMHIGMVAAVGWWLGARLWMLMLLPWLQLLQQSPPPRWVFSTTTGVVLAAAYAVLAGWSLPTQRAMLMLCVAALVTVCARRMRMLDVLALVVWPVLLWQPLALLTAAFWLSFGAVAILIYQGSGRVLLLHSRWRWHSAGWQLLRMQLGLSVCMLCLSAFFFSYASVLAPFANLVAIPLVASLVLPLLLLAMFTLQLADWGIGVPDLTTDVVLRCADLLLGLLLQWLAWLQNLPWAGFHWVQTSVSVRLLALLGALVLLNPVYPRLRWIALPLLLPLLVVNVWPAQPRDGFTVDVLDVGQGLAVVVRTARHALLFDTGPRVRDSAGAVEHVVLPFLRSRGIRHLDAIVASHSDNDHAGGLSRLQEQFPRAPVLLGGLLASPAERHAVAHSGNGESPVRACHSLQGWQWDQVRFRFLHPAPSDLPTSASSLSPSDNNGSCVLLISAGSQRVLLPGDIEAAAEAELLTRWPHLARVDMVVAPHHGSKTSSTAAWLRQLQPRHVVFSVGYRNRFGFPNESVQMRYTISNAKAYRTDRDGAVSFTYQVADQDQRAQNPRTWRTQQPRSWGVPVLPSSPSDNP